MVLSQGLTCLYTEKTMGPCEPQARVRIWTGWWFQPTPLKNDGVSNSWDDEIPNCFMDSHKIPWFQTTNQI